MAGRDHSFSDDQDIVDSIIPPAAQAGPSAAIAESSRQAHDVSVQNSNTSIRDNGLPSQEEFIANEMIKSFLNTALSPQGMNCGICLEECVPPGSRDESIEDEIVVCLKPCKHLFHNNCILLWFNSNQPERDSCPNCRKKLFVPNDLTAEQIADLYRDSGIIQLRSIGPSRRPQPHEEVVVWENFMLNELARTAVAREMARARISSTEHDWIRVSQEVQERFLAESEHGLRAIFEPYRDTFVQLLCAIAPWLVIGGDRQAVESPAYQAFEEWIDELDNQFEQGPTRQYIYQEFRVNGLFESEYIRTATVPREDLHAQYRVRARFFAVQGEIAMERLFQHQRQLAQHQHQEGRSLVQDRGFRGMVRRFSRRVILRWFSRRRA